MKCKIFSHTIEKYNDKDSYSLVGVNLTLSNIIFHFYNHIIILLRKIYVYLIGYNCPVIWNKAEVFYVRYSIINSTFFLPYPNAIGLVFLIYQYISYWYNFCYTFFICLYTSQKVHLILSPPHMNNNITLWLRHDISLQ